MSTRSAIIMKTDNPDGLKRYRGIYCHFDGYIDYVGKVLKEHYTDIDKVQALIDLGDISILDTEISPNPTLPHSFNNRQKGVVLAYHRDRGEPLHIAFGPTAKNVANQIGHNDHVYVFENGRWTHNGGAY